MCSSHYWHIAIQLCRFVYDFFHSLFYLRTGEFLFLFLIVVCFLLLVFSVFLVIVNRFVILCYLWHFLFSLT